MNVRARIAPIYAIVWLVYVVGFYAWQNLADRTDLSVTKVFDPGHPTWYSVWYGVLTFVAVIVFVPMFASSFGGWRAYIGRGIWLFNLAAAFFCTGNIAWFWYNTCTYWPDALSCGETWEAPYPSIADAGYLMLLPLAAAGLWMFGKVLDYGRREAILTLVFAVVIAVPTAWMTWLFTIGGEEVGLSWLYDSEGTFAANAISAIYTLSDIVLMSMALVLLINARKLAGGMFFPPILMAGITMFVQYWADILFFKRVANDTYYNADISDLLYGIAMWGIFITGYLFFRAFQQMMNPTAPPSTTDVI